MELQTCRVSLHESRGVPWRTFFLVFYSLHHKEIDLAWSWDKCERQPTDRPPCFSFFLAAKLLLSLLSYSVVPDTVQYEVCVDFCCLFWFFLVRQAGQISNILVMSGSVTVVANRTKEARKKNNNNRRSKKVRRNSRQRERERDRQTDRESFVTWLGSS